MKFDRTKNAKRNIAWGMVGKVFSLAIPFVMRTVIIYTLGNLYLGLNSLFSSILSALNLAELGVGSALVFAMYKPVSENNTPLIKALMNLYRKAYLIIGCVVMGVGLALVPFLPGLIKGSYPADVNLYWIYVTQLASTAFGYFFMAYKGSLFLAYQRTDITSKLTLLTEIAMYGAQAAALIFLKNFYVYTFAVLARIVIYNLLLGKLADRYYPELKAEGKIPREESKQVLIKTGALMGHKIAAVVINSVDNIFISMYIGLEMVAVYNNYYYLLTAVSGLFLMLLNGLNSIVGNYLIVEETGKIRNLFHILHCLVSFCICVCCTCFLNLYQPFVTLWVGEKSLLPFGSVILLVVCFLSIRIRTVGTLFEDSAGLWEKGIVKSYMMVLIDLVIDITLLKTIGINGALISTIATMVFAYFYESIVIHKFCLKASPIRYYCNTALYVLAIGLAGWLSHGICGMVPQGNFILVLAVNLVVSVLVSVGVFAACTCFTGEFRRGIVFAKSILKM